MSRTRAEMRVLNRAPSSEVFLLLFASSDAIRLFRSRGIVLDVPALDVAPGPLDGGSGSVAALLVAAAVIAVGYLYFRRRRKS